MSRSTTPVDPLGPEVAFLRKRQRDLEAAVGTGESGEAWRRAQVALQRLEAGLRVNPPTPASVRDINESVATLRAVLRDGVAGAQIHEEIRANAETIRRLVLATRRTQSPQDRYADREAERQAKLEEVVERLGIRPAPRPRGQGQAKAPRRQAG